MFMNGNKICLCILFISLFLMSGISIPVNAFTYDSFTPDSQASRIQDRVCLNEGTGRYVHVSKIATGVRVIVEGVSGNLADANIATGVITAGVAFVSVMDYDATHVIISTIPLSNTNPYYSQAYFLIYDTVLFTYETYFKNAVFATYYSAVPTLQNVKMQKTDDNKYVASMFASTSAPVNSFACIWFDDETDTVDGFIDNTSWASDSTSLHYSSWIYVGDDNFVCNFNWGAATYLDNHYYWLDLSLKTIVDLVSGVSSARNTNNKKLFNLYEGTGIEWSDGDAYIYNVYVYPYLVSTTTTYRLVYAKQTYNDSIITDNLLGNNEITSTISVGYTTSIYTWAVGYVTGVNHEDIYLYYLTYVGGENLLYEAYYQLSDFYDYTTPTLSLISTTEVGNTMIPIVNSEDALGWTPTGNYLARESSAGTSLYIYYDMSPVSYSFDYTISHLPNDSPLITYRTYTFTYTVTESGVGFQYAQVSLYVDNATIPSASKLTNSNGVVNQNFVFNSEGTHTIRVVISYDGNEYFDDDYDYVISGNLPSDEDFPSVALDTYVGLFINFLPATLCVMIPAMAGAKYAGLSGFMVGTLVGTGIGVQASLIPTYVIYLMILAVATGFIIIIRSGNRSSGGD